MTETKGQNLAGAEKAYPKALAITSAEQAATKPSRV